MIGLGKLKCVPIYQWISQDLKLLKLLGNICMNYNAYDNCINNMDIKNDFEYHIDNFFNYKNKLK